MRFSQAALVAILAYTVASKPIVARTDDVKAIEEYKQCCDIRDKHDPKRVCVPPTKKEEEKHSSKSLLSAPGATTSTMIRSLTQ